GCAENQHRLPAAQMEHGVDSLQRRQSRRRGRTRLQQIEALRHARHMLAFRREVLGVKADLGISEFVGVHGDTGAKAQDPPHLAQWWRLSSRIATHSVFWQRLPRLVQLPTVLRMGPSITRVPRRVRVAEALYSRARSFRSSTEDEKSIHAQDDCNAARCGDVS